MTTAPLTELLLRDPKHPEVRQQLMERYEQVCRERALLQRLLGLPEQSRRERDALAYEQRQHTAS